MVAAGADKVSLNSGGGEKPPAHHPGAAAFGSQAVVPRHPCASGVGNGRPGADKWEVYVVVVAAPTGLDAVDVGRPRAARRGRGPDLVSQHGLRRHQGGLSFCAYPRGSRVPLPVNRVGGVGELEHFARGRGGCAGCERIHFGSPGHGRPRESPFAWISNARGCSGRARMVLGAVRVAVRAALAGARARIARRERKRHEGRGFGSTRKGSFRAWL